MSYKIISSKRSKCNNQYTQWLYFETLTVEILATKYGGFGGLVEFCFDLGQKFGGWPN